jgi:hypothetical protein
MTDETIEQEIQAKGLTAPRVTPADIEAEIRFVHYFIASDAIQHELSVDEFPGSSGWVLGSTQLLTFCVIELRNGFTVTGESACASPENFDAELGRKIARQNAVQKIWPLLGFRLRDQLASRLPSRYQPGEAVVYHGNACTVDTVTFGKLDGYAKVFYDLTTLEGDVFAQVPSDDVFPPGNEAMPA